MGLPPGPFLKLKAASSYSPTDNSAVPLPLKSLTSVFGMGTGGTSPLSPPAKVAVMRTVEGGIGVPAEPVETGEHPRVPEIPLINEGG